MTLSLSGNECLLLRPLHPLLDVDLPAPTVWSLCNEVGAVKNLLQHRANRVTSVPTVLQKPSKFGEKLQQRNRIQNAPVLQVRHRRYKHHRQGSTRYYQRLKKQRICFCFPHLLEACPYLRALEAISWKLGRTSRVPPKKIVWVNFPTMFVRRMGVWC